MVPLRVIYLKVLNIAIQLEFCFVLFCLVFLLIKRQNSECNDTNFRRFLLGMSPDVGPTDIFINIW